METELFFKQVEKNYIKARASFDALNKEDELDGLYRIYHTSFKMYYEIQGAVTGYLNVLFELTGLPAEELEFGSVDEKLQRSKKHHSSLESKIKQLDLDQIFSRTVLDALNLTFEGNNEELWHEHQLKLSSAIYHATNSVSSIMHVAENYIKENRLPGQDGTLEEYEAICEHVMNFPRYRWTDKDELRKRIENCII